MEKRGGKMDNLKENLKNGYKPKYVKIHYLGNALKDMRGEPNMQVSQAAKEYLAEFIDKVIIGICKEAGRSNYYKIMPIDVERGIKRFLYPSELRERAISLIEELGMMSRRLELAQRTLKGVVVEEGDESRNP